jgi:probable rRNA maturation factor
VPVEPRVTVHGRVRPLPDGVVRRVVESVLAGERAAADVSITFLGRGAMRRLNAQYKGHDRPTDVIAFPLTAPDGRVVGDVYVCPWVAQREAAAREVPPRQELVRLIVHGTLHVLGWEHPEDESRTRSPMWRRQERYVGRLA